MKIHKQGLFSILLLLSCIGCSKKQPLEWIPFNWEGDTISGKYIEKAFIYIPVKVAGNAYFFDNTVIIDYKNKLFRVK